MEEWKKGPGTSVNASVGFKLLRKEGEKRKNSASNRNLRGNQTGERRKGISNKSFR